MLNNKGFAISSILYVLLVAFLMFLLVSLEQFTSASTMLGKANDDLINGSALSAEQRKGDNICTGNIDWYEDGRDGNYNQYIVRIKNKGTIVNWPNDFGSTITDPSNFNVSTKTYRNIKVSVFNETSTPTSTVLDNENTICDTLDDNNAYNGNINLDNNDPNNTTGYVATLKIQDISNKNGQCYYFPIYNLCK